MRARHLCCVTEAERPAAGSSPCNEETQPPASTAAPPGASHKAGHVGRCFYTRLPRNVKVLHLLAPPDLQPYVELLSFHPQIPSAGGGPNVPLIAAGMMHGGRAQA